MRSILTRSVRMPAAPAGLLRAISRLFRALSFDGAVNYLVANHNRIYALLLICALIVGTTETPHD